MDSAKKQNSKEVSSYGQEVNGSSVAMAKMNMYIHEIRDAKIGWGDTLANPVFLDADGNLLLFDAIVANMPFSKDKWASGFNPGGESSGKGKKEFKMEASLDKFHRFDWGVPPASKGDWAFLLHMIASMSVNGRIAAVAPHGVLFRGAAEGRIRQRVVKENLLDTVIGLPENLFYGTSIPACILVFKENRPTTDVLFIDASKTDEAGNLRYIKATNQNELGQEHIDAIVDAYHSRTEQPGFVHVATREEIQENEYNLNIPRYVDSSTAAESWDVYATMFGGVPKAELNEENLEALEAGLPNLLQHVENITTVYKLPCVVAINAFPTDTKAELDLVEAKCKELGVNVALSEVWAKGGEGGEELAREVVRLCENGDDEGRSAETFEFAYGDEGGIAEKIEAVAKKVYRADGVDFTPAAKKQIKHLESMGFGEFPVCMAKTQYSFSDDQTLLGAPRGFRITVREVKVSAGAGFVVALTGNIMTMPGLPKHPAAENIDVDETGKITGLF